MSREADRLRADVEARRLECASELVEHQRVKLGQFFTPRPTAALIASMPTLPSQGTLRVLDPGAGVGSLTAELVGRVKEQCPDLKLELTTYEIDAEVNRRLADTLLDCANVAPVSFEQHHDDFLQAAPAILADPAKRWDLVIMNPPYRKIRKDSEEQAPLSEAGVDTTNLYTAFVALGLRMLTDRGQLVAITPRSFANGTYFRSFRRELLSSAALRRLHIFERRNAVFADSSVLQENVIFHVERGAEQGDVVISTSQGADEDTETHIVPFSHVVDPADSERFIHIATRPEDLRVAAVMAALPAKLSDLGIEVSTGRVVDFRTKDNLRATAGSGDAPLLFPQHLSHGRVAWPQHGRKPNGLAVNESTRALLLPSGTYSLVKRFTAKEEPRRVSAALLTGDDVPGPVVAIENHLNVFHSGNVGLEEAVAAGLTAYLNSSIVDRYVRLFSGHTQINAGDLRSLRYPSYEQLRSIGNVVGREVSVGAVDAAVLGIVPELASL
jgi:adenine-specific DNA-methyltransferase